ncbi:iron-sulfur cluster repair protein YtfE (RIC family) [Sphingobium xenophagum]|uniref:Iron-sulfur cluster repair protein YtfE (RIC family) n=1 Tax=Sphingobium xenophagum TaxID=121428 RepID=A0ABU1X396_SPHXE|nr:hemerythrin domain-containing protein [Sphingobium xenophagum]MDR7156028.1 iron-sulfur cluster repair protein YtfE (RIC family) [Sphingobium xenophagum]
MMDMAGLREQHKQISLTARQLAQATSDTTAPQSVAALRWSLARQLIAHLALEDRILYPKMQRSANPLARKTALQLQGETGALAEGFTRYMAAWSDDRIAREWPAFCAETQAILATLTQRVDRENRTLYPLADEHQGAGPPVARAG